jgi:hypothetical protein
MLEQLRFLRGSNSWKLEQALFSKFTTTLFGTGNYASCVKSPEKSFKLARTTKVELRHVSDCGLLVGVGQRGSHA